MKYWSDGYDTYAALELKSISKEQYAQHMIEDSDFNQENWKEVSKYTMMWIDEVSNIEAKRKKGRINFLIVKIKWYRPLWWVFLFHRPPSDTGIAWFMCSTEY